jgi:multiple sugar transport system substrate-binding protein
VAPPEPAQEVPTALPEATPPVAPTPVAERVRVEFFGEPGAEGWLDRFHEEHPDLEYFEILRIEGVGAHEQLMSLVAAGTPPDCARVESSFYRTFAHYGLLLPITENIKADPEFSKPDYWIQPQESDRSVYEGEWYGIGSCWVAPHFYYNMDFLDEMGVEPPSNDPDEAWGWDQFLDIVRQLTVDVNGKHPGETGFDENNIDRWGVNWPTWWIPLHAAVQSNGVAWVDEAGKIVLDTPEAMEALQRISDLMFAHRLMPRADVMAGLGMAGAQLLETGKVLLVVDGSWALNWLWEIKGTLGTAVLPKMMRPATDMQAHLVTIVKGTRQPDNAWRLIRFLSSPFFQELNLRTGLWLPSQTALMTKEAIARWCQPPVHPPGYELIVTEYTPKYGHYLTMPVGYLKAVDAALQPAFDELFAGRARAEDVLPEAVENANRIMEEEQARPTLQ